MAEEFKQITRIGGVDIPGKKALFYALSNIKGVGYGFSNAICNLINKDKNMEVGKLSDAEIKKIDDAIKDPLKNKIPGWLLNRRKDYDKGQDLHLIRSDLDLRREFDIKRLKNIKSYRGIRHAQGQPTRGQRTRSHFRTGPAVGVKKKEGVKKGKV